MIIFTPNTVIRSADVNLNFDELADADTALDTRVTTLENVNPLVYAYRASGSSSPLTGPLRIGGYTATYNVGSCLNASTGVFTASKAGYYYVNFSGFTENAINLSGALDIRKNSTASIYRTFYSQADAGYATIGTTGIVQCAVNDTIDIFISAGMQLHGSLSSNLTIFCLSK